MLKDKSPNAENFGKCENTSHGIGTYMRTYIHTYTHTYVHTDIHTYTLRTYTHAYTYRPYSKMTVKHQIIMHGALNNLIHFINACMKLVALNVVSQKI